MALFIYQNLNSQIARTFPKNVNKEAAVLFKKQLILLFTVVFCPIIHNVYLKRYNLLTLLPFFVFPSLFFNFCVKVEAEILL